MAIKIYFDAQHNPEKPTFNLATRRGIKYAGILPAENIVVSDRMNDVSEVTFKIRKYADGVKYHLWDYLKDFKLLYCREWNMWLETKVELDESTETIKTVYGTNLGRSELTNNAILHNIEINTELDISRDDYDPDYPTIMYRPNNHPEASLLHRIMEKVPSYKVRHVDPSIANLQRVFTFDGISVYEAFKKIEEELDCIFVFHTAYEDGSICREISVYDLHSWCDVCGYRGEFLDVCPKCGNTGEDQLKAIHHGYGNDTTIFVTSDELADNIQYVTDTDSVKNIFYLEAGDDLMTATVRNCLPDGSGYLRGITAETREDMSSELQKMLSDYDVLYQRYQTTEKIKVNTTSVSSYNELIEKYDEKYNLCICNNCGKKSAIKPGDECTNCKSKSTEYCQQLEKINKDGEIIGYPALMKTYYDTIDFALFLQSEMMPRIENVKPDINSQRSLLQSSLTSVSVQNIGYATDTTVNNAVLSMAKVLIDPRYEVEISSSSITDTSWEVDEEGNYVLNAKDEKIPTRKEWRGYFVVTDITNESSKTTTSEKAIVVNNDYESYVKQKLDKALAKLDSVDVSISGLFELSESGNENSHFARELQNYCLARLSSFRDACQTCLDILIEYGASEYTSDAYQLYLSYYKKLQLLDDELKIRTKEIQIITGIQDANGKTTQPGIQTYLLEEIEYIQSQLNLENYLGYDLWCELCNYCREDTYSNENYISDGLDNKGLFEMAQSFIEEAKRELFKSANLQHSISCSLKNLLTIPKFAAFVEYFELGNWIRVQIDDVVYRLRLISYEIDYDNIQHISVEFSDVMKTMVGMSDAQSVIEQMQVIGGSYTSVKQQAQKGEESKKVLDNWIYNSLDLTNMKIVSNADNQDIVWDSHGLLLRMYYPESDLFDNKQLKFIYNGMYFTTDGWKTVKTGVGSFMLYNPKTGQTEEAYGVIAETLVGNLILSEEVGVYNTTGSVAIDKNGILVIADATEKANEMSITIQKKTKDDEGQIVYEDIFGVDSNGDLYLNGSVKIQTTASGDVTSIDDLCSDDRLDASINERIYDLQANNNYELERYKAEVGQYLTFDNDGLKIGANVNGLESSFSTVLDNRRLAFKEDGETIAYMNGYQMYISNAIIENILAIGNYYFVPLIDINAAEEKDVNKGMVVLWKNDIEMIPVSINPLGTFSNIIAGESITITATISGSVDSIEWKYSLDNGSNWTEIAKNTTICTIDTPSDAATGDQILVRCTAFDYDGASTTSTGTIVLVNNNEESDDAVDTYSVTYNLENYTSSLMVESVLAGGSFSTTLTPVDGYTYDSHDIYMVGNSGSGISFDSGSGKLTINNVTGNIVINIKGKPIVEEEEFAIITYLQDSSVIVGGNSEFTITTNKPGESRTYKWQTSTSGSTWNTVNTVTTTSNSDTYTINAVTESQKGLKVRCVIEYNDTTYISNIVTIYISISNDAIVIDSITAPANVKCGSNKTYDCVIKARSLTGDTLTYEWYYSNNTTSGWTEYGKVDNNNDDPATLTQYAPIMSGTVFARNIYCLVKDSQNRELESSHVIVNFN